MKHTISTLIILAAASVLVGGCTQGPDAQSDANGSPPEHKKQTAEESEPANTGAAVATTLSAYEDIRAKLAADDIEGAAAQGEVLATAANTAAAAAPETLRGHLSKTAKAAEALSGAPTDDADAVRKAFGEVSRSVVALVHAEPAVQEGLHVFECPMAQGYPKWVQRTETVENPYMGQNMLACGSETEWSD